MGRYRYKKPYKKKHILKGAKISKRKLGISKGRWKIINKEKKKKNKLFIPIIVIDVFVLACFFIFYGPFNIVKDFLITTAMTTKSHKYLARTFYSSKTINNVLSNNKVIEFDTGNDLTKIQIGVTDDNVYASIYEKDILDHDGDYKLIEFKYNGYQCYLVAIYDPTRVSLMESTYIGYYGQRLTDMSRDNNAIVAINAGGFEDVDALGNVGYGSGGIPTGIVIKNNKVVSGNPYINAGITGFNNEGILMLTYTTGIDAISKGMKYGVQFGPFLIVNGVSATIYGNGGWGINPRTAIAQRKDGIVLFLVVDGNGANKYNWNGRGGITMKDLIVILERYGAYNAANMDGGASTTLSINSKLINSPCGYSGDGQRGLPNAWMFK